METQVVITGGFEPNWQPSSNVAIYDEYGLKADLPPLNVGRGSHGCGYYRNQNDQIVEC